MTILPGAIDPQLLAEGGLTPLGSFMLKGATVPQRVYGVA
jgi:hypothetical protein